MVPMEIGMVFPVLPGQREALVAFANALMHERKAEYEASQTTVVKESWFLQSTPSGDLCVAHFEAPDVAAVMQGLATSDEPFDVWFRERVLATTGVDLASGGGSMPEQIFGWRRS